MIQVTVALASGRRKSLSILESSKVEDLRKLAQKFFGQGCLQLATADGCILSDPMQTLQAAGLQDDQLMAIVGQVKLTSNRQAFAAWCCGATELLHGGHRD